MTFGEKVQKLRIENKMFQKQLAEKVGVSLRTIAYYESDEKMPKNIATTQRLAQALGTTINYLLSDEEVYMIEAHEKGGKKSEREIESLLSNVSALFAGGDLTEDDRDKVFKAINEIYWDTKEKNKEKKSAKESKK